MNIEIPQFENPAALLRPDRDALTAETQNIYLVLDAENDRVGVTTLTEAGREGTSVEVPTNKRFRVRLPDNVDASRLEDWVKARADLLREIFDGCSLGWAKSEMRCQLDERGRSALTRLKREARASDIPRHGYQLWNARQWLQTLEEGSVAQRARSHRTNRGEVETLVDEVEARAQGEGVVLYDTEEAIRTGLE